MVDSPLQVSGRFVGQAVLRKEDPRLLTGFGEYVDDIVVPGTLHAAFVRSNIARGRIRSLDLSQARALTGVVAVFTAADLVGLHGEGWNAKQPTIHMPEPLALQDVRFVGDPVAIVVAESRSVAEDACELIDVDVEPDPPVVDYRKAALDTKNVVHRSSGSDTNVMLNVPFTSHDAAGLQRAFDSAKHVVECTIEQNRYLPVPLEGRGVLASWNPGRHELKVYASSQAVHAMREFLARYLRVPQAHVEVTARDVGGAFGQKAQIYREECAVVLATRLLGRPVKWIEDRRENLLSASHSRNEQARVTFAFDGDAMIDAVSVEHCSDMGAYVVGPARADLPLFPGPYRTPFLGYSSLLTWTNTMGRGAYRGPWMFETTAREVALDVAARRLGWDPIDIRRRNLLTAADLPFKNPGGLVFEEITPRETFERALEILEYETFRNEQALARSDGRYLGLGASVYVEPTAKDHPTLHTEAATIRVDTNGKVVVSCGSTSQGQSVETTLAQLVAERLGVDYSDVTVVQGDTRTTPYGPITGGSRTAVVASGAVQSAADKVLSKILAVASHLTEASTEDLVVEAGRVSVRSAPSRSLSLQDIAEAAYWRAGSLPEELAGGLEASARFRPTRYPTWSNATHLCVVEVDGETWIPRIKRFIVVEDCGRIINPMVVDGQVSGGVVQGLGGVIFEDFRYDDDGNPLTTTFMDYLLPTISDVPAIEIEHIQTPSTTNPGGFKGVGEGGAVGAPAAVLNAIADALAPLGVEITRTHLGPDEIFSLVRQYGRGIELFI